MHMPTALWRTVAVICGIIVLALIGGESFDTRDGGEPHVVGDPIHGQPNLGRVRVRLVDGTIHDNGGIQVGDIITIADDSLPSRLRASRATIGVPTVWTVQRGNRTFQATTYTTGPQLRDIIQVAVVQLICVCNVIIALVLAIRRPDHRDARALASFLIGIGYTVSGGSAELPDPLYLTLATSLFAVQWFALAQALRFACIFPFESSGGLRRWIQRFTPPYAIVGALVSTAFVLRILLTQRLFDFAPLNWFGNYGAMYFFVAITIAFVIAARQATGIDKQRVIWASSSLGIGFFGPLVATMFLVAHVHGAWIGLLPMTFVVIPVGLAYTILRHRTIDIGFVVSRALVFGILSFIVVATFGVLEWFLGKVVVQVSHLTSQSLELALAIGLGFSLRPIHRRVDRFVDNLFFRDRHRAEANLRRFARDIGSITSVPVLLDRTVAVVMSEAQASAACIYVYDGTAFARVAGVGNDGHFPLVVDENDPVFVRLRATREDTALTRLESTLDAEHAFPMLVRGQLFGALVCCAKTTSEAYDPDEIRHLGDIANAAGTTIDVLHTEALKREIDRVLAEGGPLDELRSVRHRLPIATALTDPALYDTIRAPL